MATPGSGAPLKAIDPRSSLEDEAGLDVPSPDAEANNADFGYFFRTEFMSIVGYIKTKGVSDLVAEDIVQEAMIEVYRKWGTIGNPKAYLRKVSSNMAARAYAEDYRSIRGLQLRSGVRGGDDAMREAELQPATAQTPEESAVGKEIYNALMQAVEELPKKQRQVILRSLDGASNRDIAAALGAQPTSVRNALHHGRKALLRRLEKTELL